MPLPDTGTAYPLARRWRLVGWIFPPLGLVLGTALLWPPINHTLPLVLVMVPFAVALLALCTVIAVDFQRCRLQLGPGGIDYLGIGYRVRAPWPAVRYVDADGPKLILDQPELTVLPWLGLLLKIYRMVELMGLGHRAAILARTRLIDLRLLTEADADADGPLAELRRRAPQLFPP
jgi:hypothetical protein